MSAFDYSNPVKFYFGAGKFNQLGEIASTHGRKVLLVVSDSTKHTGQLERAQLALSEADIAFAIYDRFMQNPLSTLVEEGAALARDERCDLVIGIGAVAQWTWPKASPSAPVMKGVSGTMCLAKTGPARVAGDINPYHCRYRQ